MRTDRRREYTRHVRDALARHGRADDYIEVSLASPYRYNPLHNDLDAYALAYGIATLMTNLFGRGKEPFWQQASTNLVNWTALATNAAPTGLWPLVDTSAGLQQRFYRTRRP